MYLRTIDRQRAEVSCDHCNTVFVADREEGGGASIEQWACQGSDECQVRMCDECRTVCDACGLTACSEHLIDFGGERLCSICMSEAVESGEVVHAA